MARPARCRSSRASLAAGLALLGGLLGAGCERDPVMLGFWDIIEVEVDLDEGTLRQDDMGTLEFTEGEGIFVLRYRLRDGALEPVARPTAETVSASTGDRSDELGETYVQEGEVHTLTLGVDVYVIDEYNGSDAFLVSESAAPPGYFNQPQVEEALAVPVRWSLIR